MKKAVISVLLFLLIFSCFAAAAEDTPMEPPELRGAVLPFPKNQRYPVYLGPGERYGRAGDGRAVVSTNGEITCFGTCRAVGCVGDFLLIRYEIAEGYSRFGWISVENVPSSVLEKTEPLRLFLQAKDGTEENLQAVILEDVSVTDDPDESRAAVGELKRGSSVHLCARYGDWLLVEYYSHPSERPEYTMGFVPAEKADTVHGYVRDAVPIIDRARTYSEEDILAAMDAVKNEIYAHWPGTSLINLKYREAESADPEDWWQEPGEERMELFCDLDDICMRDFEVGGYDYGFILRRTPDGAWEVINWGYE